MFSIGLGLTSRAALERSAAPRLVFDAAVSLAENSAPGTVVVTVAASNGGELGGLSLAGAGSEDFTFAGDSLEVVNPPNYEARAQYVLTIGGTIDGAPAADRILTIAVTDIIE